MGWRAILLRRNGSGSFALFAFLYALDDAGHVLCPRFLLSVSLVPRSSLAAALANRFLGDAACRDDVDDLATPSLGSWLAVPRLHLTTTHFDSDICRVDTVVQASLVRVTIDMVAKNSRQLHVVS